jgi:outer membrane protein assembly factor BamB
MRALVVTLALVLAASGCGREAGNLTEPEDSQPKATASASTSRGAQVLRVSADGRQLWSVGLEAGDDSPNATRPIVDGDNVITTMGGELRRLSLDTGDEHWRYRAGETIYGAWLAGSRILAVVDQVGPNARVVAVDAGTGREEWRWDAGGRGLLGTQEVVDDTDLAVLTSAHKLVVIDSATGRPRWQADGKGGEFHGIAIVPGSVLFAEGGILSSRDSKTGAIRWTADFSPEDRPVVVGQVVTGSSIGAPRAGPREGIDIETGKVLWTMAIEDAEDPGEMYALDDAFVLEDSRSRRLRLIEPSSGKVRWSADVGGPVAEFGGLLQTGSVLHVLRYSRTDPAVLTFDMATGRSIGTLALDETPDGPASAAGDSLLFVLQGEHSAIASVKNGQLEWSFDLPSRATRGPTGLDDGGAVIEVVEPMTGTVLN